MRSRIFRSIMLTSVIILTLSVVLVMAAVYGSFRKESEKEIATEAIYISEAYNAASDAGEYLNLIGRQSKNRITLIASDGTVRFDNFTSPEKLENHAGRPEVAAALSVGEGSAERNSDTLGAKTYYYAVRLNDGNVLRIAATMKSIVYVVDDTAPVIFIIIAAAVLITIIAARLLTTRIVEPINEIDLDVPVESGRVYDELSPLAVRIDRQNKKIREQIAQLSEKQRELSYITDNMNEALVIYSNTGKVLSINRSACRLFGNYKASENAAGIGYLELCRDIGYIKLTESAFAGERASGTIERFGRIWRLTADPVENISENDEIDGEKRFSAVLFGEDMTEKERSEQLRREFSANVSHELKTPLTSIMGYAEIMQNGIAKKDDFPEFISSIYSEAKRLLSLINDIIRLSQLDEQASLVFEPIDLYETALQVVNELRAKADAADVAISISGEHAVINGSPQPIHEMLFNLCDNAVTYNREGGHADISITKNGAQTVLAVSDNGIGIAEDACPRVFERFYRVDKSRSKQCGGTGLGLSIVKHAAMAHNAQIELESKPGVGTTIKVIF